LSPIQTSRPGIAWKVAGALASGAAAHAESATRTGKASRLLTLAPADLIVICVYFALVLGVGLYLKRRVRASKDFFFAGKGVGSWGLPMGFAW
jgi:hypothetical protein